MTRVCHLSMFAAWLLLLIVADITAETYPSDLQPSNFNCTALKLFDAHCHLQDPRILNMSSQAIQYALNQCVFYMALNGIEEKDWPDVKEMGENYSSIIPNYGLHPWFVNGRTSTWFETLKAMLYSNPTAAVGEIGLDKSSLIPPEVVYSDQFEVFRKQLELAKELNRPVTVHCLNAFDDLFSLMRSIDPFPAGIILHSFAGTAEMVPELTALGSYFSFSGHLMSREVQDATRMLKAIPMNRILLETDSPDGLPIYKRVGVSTNFVPGTLNQPAYIRDVLSYVASLLEISEEGLARTSYVNAVRVFSFTGSKLLRRR